MKKYLSLILALVMMASVLAGCGGKEEAPAASAPAAAAGEELTFTTGGDITEALSRVREENLSLQAEREALVRTHFEEGFLYAHFGTRVNRRGSLVEYEHRRESEHYSRY